MEKLLGMLSDNQFINEEATERKDDASKVVFKAEWTGYTPLMLAVVSPHSDFETIKHLLEAKVDTTRKEKATGNNILHLCAERCQNVKVFEHLTNILNDQISETNAAGETAMSICQKLKKSKFVKVVDGVFDSNDKSAQMTSELLDDLLAEEEKDDKAKAKRKEKKQRSKMQKLAEKHGCTVDQLEMVFKE